MIFKTIKKLRLSQLVIVAVVLALTFPVSVSAQSFAKVGIVGGQFLKIGVGAEIVGMGSSAMATVDDAQAVFWNPSGLTSIKNTSVYLSQVNWFAGVKYISAAAAKNLGRMGTIGLSFSYLTSGDMDVTTYSQQEGTGETFGYSDLMLGVSWARNLTDRFSFGITAKYVVEDFGFNDDVDGTAVKAQAIAFDIGTQYITGLKSLKMGIAIQNFGPELSPSGAYEDIIGYDSKTQDYIRVEAADFKSYPMPMVFKVGVMMDLLDIANHKLTVAADALHPSDNEERVNVGVQYSLYNALHLRGGYIFNADAATFSLGAGFTLKGTQIDYAFSQYVLLDELHTISVGFNH